MSTPTPWGPAQSEKTIAPGITSYTTAGHGGIHLTMERVQAMPAALRAITPYAHNERDPLNECGRWYEEDCDWALVALAFPEHFDDYSLLCAVQTVRPESYMAMAATWLENDPQGRALRDRVDAWKQAHASDFRHGGCCTSGGGWIAHCSNIAGTETLTVRFPEAPARDSAGRWQGFYALPSYFPESRIAELGGQITKREAVS